MLYLRQLVLKGRHHRKGSIRGRGAEERPVSSQGNTDGSKHGSIGHCTNHAIGMQPMAHSIGRPNKRPFDSFSNRRVTPGCMHSFLLAIPPRNLTDLPAGPPQSRVDAPVFLPARSPFSLLPLRGDLSPRKGGRKQGFHRLG